METGESQEMTLSRATIDSAAVTRVSSGTALIEREEDQQASEDGGPTQ
jgi:hypothetical protein